MKRYPLIIGALSCMALAITPLTAKDSTITVVKPSRVIGDPKLRVGDDVSRVLMTDDGKRLVSCSNDGTIRWWDVTTRKEVRRWAPEKASTLWDFRLLPNDRMLVAHSNNKVSLVDLKTGKELKSYKHEDSVYRLCASKDGKRFLACGSFKTAILWDVESGKKERTFKGHTEDIYCVNFSHDETVVYTCGDDKSWRAHSVETGDEQWQKAPDAGNLYVLSRHPSEDVMVVGSEKKSLWMVDLKSGEKRWDAAIGKSVQSVAWSPDGKKVAANGDQLSILDAKTGKELVGVKLPDGYNWGICWSLDGKRVYTTASNVILEFDAENGRRLFPASEVEIVTGGASEPRCVSSAGTIFFRAGKGIRRMDGKTGKPLETLLKNTSIRCMETSPDGKLLACGESNGKVQVLNAKEESATLEMKEGDSSIQALVFSPDGKHLFGGSSNGKVHMWRLKDGSRVRTFEKSGPKKKRRAPVADGNNAFDFFNAADNINLEGFDWGSVNGSSSSVKSLAISPDGLMLAGVYEGNTVVLWKTDDATIAETLAGDSDKASVKKCLFVQDAQLSLIMHGTQSNKQTLFSIWRTPMPAKLTVTQEAVDALIKQLGADSFRDRRKATKAVTALGSAIIPKLRKVNSKDPEISFRIKKILAALGDANGMKRIPVTVDCKSVIGIAPAADGKNEWLAICDVRGQRHIDLMTLKGTTITSRKRFMGDSMHGSVYASPSKEIIVGNKNGTITIFTND